MFTKTNVALATAVLLSYGAQADTILNVATAGDQNMVDYVKTWLGPKFEAAHPGVKVQVIGTGPGDAGSNKIIEKLTAQKASGASSWDIDVAVVHQKAGGELVEKGLLEKYRQQIKTGSLVSADNAHAQHPNHPELADSGNAPKLGSGIDVIYPREHRSLAREIALHGAVVTEFWEFGEGVGTRGVFGRLDVIHAPVGVKVLHVEVAEGTGGAGGVSIGGGAGTAGKRGRSRRRGGGGGRRT